MDIKIQNCTNKKIKVGVQILLTGYEELESYELKKYVKCQPKTISIDILNVE
jgi:hypothetical protein